MSATVSAMALCIASGPAQAQSRQIDVPAQAAPEAIATLSRQTGVQILLPGRLAGARTAAVSGSMTVEEALRRMLEGTGLVARQTGADTWTIVREPAGAAPTSQAAGGEAEIVVTGTNIRGTPPASPVTSRSRRDIEDAGQADLGAFARSLTQNYSGGQNPNVAGAGNQGGQNNLNGSSALNLRGLGPDATLTLINGHRTAYDALNQGVDISAIPVSAVERVEIVADGASALYGSDAVGGVANIILRRDFQGLETTMRVGAATDGGAAQQQYTGVTGMRWGSGGIIGVVDYSDSTAVYADQRSYTRMLQPSMTLYPALRQTSLLAAGHQAITDGVSFEFDGQFAHRKSEKVVPYTVTASVLVNGQDSRPSLNSFTFAPSLKIDLPAGWRATLGGVYAGSDSDLDSLRYTSSVRSQGISRYHNRTTTGDAGAEGPLFDTGGGTARLALGAGFRANELGVYIEQISAAGVHSVSSDFTARRDIYYGFGEVSLPLVGGSNRLPLVERLVLNAAVRYENYRGVGDVFAPKLGLVYEPIPAITIRASWGKSFKAQTLYQEFQARQVNLIRSESFPGGTANHTVILLSGGNSGLKPERATTLTAGVTVRPVEGLSLEASYFDIHYKDRIADPLTSDFGALTDPLARNYVIFAPSPAQVATAVASGPEGFSNQTGAPYDPSSVEAIIDGSLRNISRQRIRGVDFGLDYRARIGTADTLRLTGSVSYVTSERQLAPGQPTRPVADIVFSMPHWRGRGGASWQHAGVTLSSYLNYIGGTLDNRFAPDVRVASFTSLDTLMRIRSGEDTGMLKNAEMILSATNLLNRKPSAVRRSSSIDPPYDSTNYPSLGRTVSLTLRKAW